MMMLIDMTRELSPLLMGFNVVLVISGLGLVAASVGTAWMRKLSRPRLTLQRPALAGAR
jgi:nucleoside phosphorylase